MSFCLLGVKSVVAAVMGFTRMHCSRCHLSHVSIVMMMMMMQAPVQTSYLTAAH